LARAKSTERAEARRRYRAAQVAAQGGDAEASEIEETETAPVEQPRQPLFRPPDLRADLAALPGILRGKRGIWIAFALMPIAAAVPFLVPVEPGNADGTVAFVLGTFFQLCLFPQATVPTFIAGFVTPRAAYLVGLLIGIVNAVLVVLVVTRIPGAEGVDLPSTVALVVITDTVLCAFASWYRRFLKGTQERQRAVREARIREQRRQQRTAGRRPGAKGAAR
jgi:hypothetical protein